MNKKKQNAAQVLDSQKLIVETEFVHKFNYQVNNYGLNEFLGVPKASGRSELPKDTLKASIKEDLELASPEVMRK